MTEPSTAWAAIASGFAAAAMAALGLEPPTLLWAAIGVSLGIPASDPTSRARALITFVLFTLASALLATWAAMAWFDAPLHIKRNGLALAIGMCFFLLRSRLHKSVPEFWDWALKRLGVRT